MPKSLTKKTVRAYALSVLPLLCEMLPSVWRVRDIRVKEKIKNPTDDPKRKTVANTEWHGDCGDGGSGGPEVTFRISMMDLRETPAWRHLVIARIVHEIGHTRTTKAETACQEAVDEALKDRRRVAKKIKILIDDMDEDACISLEVLAKYFLVNEVHLP